jgi:hypothetical protein
MNNMHNTNYIEYDYIIIGGGMAGLYAGYNLKKHNKSFKIFEKEKYLGGRAIMIDFQDKKVVGGAGIGRVKKDILLKNLCDELKIQLKTYKAKVSYHIDNPINLMEYVENLKKIGITKKQRSIFNMKQWLDKTIGDYKIFSLTAGYTDFLKADVLDTLYDYGFEDNVAGYDAYSMPWGKIVDELEKILTQHIVKNYSIESVKTLENGDVLINNKYICKKLICTAMIPELRELFPDLEILKEIQTQSFSRIYAKIDKDGNEKLKEHVKNFTIVDSFLQKFIPMYQDKGIYMIGYNDNEFADKGMLLFDSGKICQVLEEEVKRLFNIDVKIEDGKICYWKDGTTYFLPLKKEYKDRNEWLEKAMYPYKNIYLCGEGFSKNQGWVEGALESVLNVLRSVL